MMTKFTLCRFRVFIFSILASLGSLVLGTAQSGYNIGIQRYSMSDGLIHNHIYQTFEDSRGFIWVVTSHGLNFFNGSRFVEVMRWPALANPLDARIETEDHLGYLWVRLVDKKEIKFNLVQIRTQLIYAPSDIWRDLPSGIADVAMHHSGSLLISDLSGNLWEKSSIQAPKLLYNHTGGIFSIVASQVTSDRLWISAHIQPRFQYELSLVRLSTGTVSDKVFVEAKNSYFSTTDGDLNWVDQQGIHQLTAIGKRNFPISASTARLLRWDMAIGTDSTNGNTWIISQNKVIVVHPEEGELYDFSKNFVRTPSLGDVFHVFIDRRHIAWVSSINGLYQIDFSPNKFNRLLWNDPTRSSNPFVNSCRGILEHSNGRVVVNYGTKMGIFDSNLSRAEKTIELGASYFGIAEDVDGKILLGGPNVNLIALDPRSGRQEIITNQKQSPGNLIWSIFPEKERIWLGLDQGLGYVDRASGQFSFYSLDKLADFSADLRASTVYHIERSPFGNGILLATSTGLFEIDEAYNISKRYWKAGQGEWNLPAENIRHFSRDASGIFWLATVEGLLRWNPSTGEKRLYDEKYGIPNNILYAIYSDVEGNLWMSSDNGIIQFDPIQADFHYYLTKEGVTHEEFNRISHCRLKNGLVLFGGLNGITSFDPSGIKSGQEAVFRPSLALQRATVYTDRSTDGQSIMPEFDTKGGLEIASGTRLVKLKFAHTDYPNRGLTEIRYFIEGLMTDWQLAEDGLVQLTGLPPGKYLLQVKTTHGSGLSSGALLRFPMLVYAPLYKKYWFWVLVVVSVGLLAFFFIALRWRMLRSRQVELEDMVDRRTEKIEQANRLIAEQTERISWLADEKVRFFANISHEFRTPISLIVGSIRSIQSEIGANSRYDDLISIAVRNSQSLLRMVNEILSVSSAESFERQMKWMPVDLESFCNDMLQEFQLLASQKQLDLQLKVPEGDTVIIDTDPNLLGIIINNLLSNAIKFTPKRGNIRLSFEVHPEEGQVEIVLVDSGRGIHPIDLPHIFDRFYQTKVLDSIPEGGTGIGLSLAKEMTELLGGTIQVSSEWEHGAEFSIRLPLRHTTKAGLECTAQEDKMAKVPAQGIADMTAPDYTLLIVEDNPDFQVLLRKLLRSQARVISVQNGKEALQYLKGNPVPDMIICDLMMPELDGFSFLRALKSLDVYAGIPVVVYSARSGEEDLKMAYELGAAEYLVKPVAAELLEWTVRRLLIPKITTTIQQLVVTSAERVLTEEEVKWVQILDQIVGANLSDQEFSVDYLAQKMLMSRTPFFQTVSELTGMTPNAYIKEARLQKARMVLEQEQFKSIKEVSDLVGWRDVTYFTKLYKIRFGKAPSSYVNKP